MDNDNGIVYLVGAGPGDPGLLTLKGADCLRKADVVVYDNLANPELLNFAPPDAEIIYAGKMADQHTKSQDEINEILSQRARKGLTVVRLKGGDPFLFGRGGEEAAWLTKQGLRWEVVSGVTSAIAVPAYAGIPVTHRIVNGSLHIVTGHENVEGLGTDVDWAVLAKSRGTLVFLMGVKQLGQITAELIKHGMPRKTPVAMIQWGTTPDQKTLVSNLENVVKDVAAAGIKPPAIGVVGHVVDLRKEMNWFENRPLFGLRVAVTRPRNENDSLAERLRQMGAEVVQTPTIKVVPLPMDAAQLQKLERLKNGTYDWIVFTSGNAVRLFREALIAGGGDSRMLAAARIAAIGARTAEALTHIGLQADLVSEDAHQEGLAASLSGLKPKQVLIPRALEARPVLEQVLQSIGAQTEVLPLYKTVPDEVGIARLNDWLRRGRLQMITFTSAKTFEALAENWTQPPGDSLKGVATAVIGPVTSAALIQAGVVVSVEAPRADMASLAEAITDWYRNQRL